MTDRIWLWLARGMLGLAQQVITLAALCDEIPAQAREELLRGVKQIYDAVEKK